MEKEISKRGTKNKVNEYRPKYDIENMCFRCDGDLHELHGLFFSSDNFIKGGIKKLMNLENSKDKEAILFDFAFTLKRVVQSEVKEIVDNVLKQLNK